MEGYLFDVRQRPELPVLKKDGFQLCDNNFTITGFSRVEGKRLRELFNPEIRKTGQLKAEKEAKKLFKKPFFAAQLKYYDIKFKSSSKVDDLRSLLVESVTQGKCDRLPESTSQFQRKMLTEYKPMRQKWESDIRAWEEQQRQHEIDEVARITKLKEDHWKRCTTPQERANCDFDWFLNHHYLTDGKPDRRKTPEVVVYGFLWLQRLLEENVPGLYMQFCDSIWGGRSFCAGWDRSAVLRVAQEETRRAQERRKREEEEMQRHRDAEWEKTIQPHFRYLQRSATKKELPRSFELQRCTGSYIIRCDEISAGWAVMDDFTMDVSIGVDGTLIATYNFSIIEGTALLGLSEDKLDDLAVELDTKSDSEDDEYGYGYDEEDDDQPNVGGKRAAAAAPNTSEPPRKRRKTTPPVPRRVYFRMRGRETSEGEIFFVPEPGHLDFLDNTCTKFAGLFYENSYRGSNVPFEGYKVADEPKVEKPEEWQKFSERAYDRAARRRWGGR